MVRGTVGQVKGHWAARITYYDAHGKRRHLTRYAPTKADAIDLRDQLIRSVAATRGEIAKKATFSELVQHYRAQYAKPAEYVGDTKVAGLRSHKSIASRLDLLEAILGPRRLVSITWGDCNEVRQLLLAQDSRRGTPRSVTDVNRVMEILRRLFRLAVSKGWILVSPFDQGDGLIQRSDENHRERVVSPADERKLLKAADPWLRDAIILLIDTGLRAGELASARITDVDLKARVLRITKRNSKTARARIVPLTARCVRILKGRDDKLVERNDLYHPFVDLVTSLGMDGLRLHDLRHTCGTRLAQGGLSLAEVARILGHSQIATTFRYLNADESTFAKARKILG